MVFCLCFNKNSHEDQSTELATLVNHRSQTVVAHPLITAFKRQRQRDLSEFKTTLGYMRLGQSKREAEPSGGQHTFNSSSREVEMGSDNAGQREECKLKETGAQT